MGAPLTTGVNMQPIAITIENKQLILDQLNASVEAGGLEMVIRKHDSSLKARQRALVNIWYGDIAKAQGIRTAEAEAYCKYHFGLKLASANDPDRDACFRAMLSNHDYEIKLQIIEDCSDLFPILRSSGGLTSEQTAEYLLAIQQHFANQSIVLISSNDTELLNCRAAQG